LVGKQRRIGCKGGALWPRQKQLLEHTRLQGRLPAGLHGEFCAAVLVEFDQDWANQSHPDPSMPPRSHAVRGRVEEHYMAKACDGNMKIDEYRTKIFPVLADTVLVIADGSGSPAAAAGAEAVASQTTSAAAVTAATPTVATATAPAAVAPPSASVPDDVKAAPPLPVQQAPTEEAAPASRNRKEGGEGGKSSAQMAKSFRMAAAAAGEVGSPRLVLLAFAVLTAVLLGCNMAEVMRVSNILDNEGGDHHARNIRFGGRPRRPGGGVVAPAAPGVQL